MTIEFAPFPKIARFNRDIIITEKIDGTNACVVITEDGEIAAQSRNKIITPGKKTDNMGFAGWVEDNKRELMDLGPGRHFGEWWGAGIQRGYGLPKGEKRFSLFNVARWSDEATGMHLPQPANDEERAPPRRPSCCHVVPTLYEGPMCQDSIDMHLHALAEFGSLAAPGFMDPEGLIVFNTAAGTLFKVTCKDDERPKGLAA